MNPVLRSLAACALLFLASAQLPVFGSMGFRGVVWNDVNGNGIRDLGEPGINGVRVWLYRELAGAPIPFPFFDLGLTANDGIEDGTYNYPYIGCNTNGFISVELPEGFTFTSFQQGNNSSRDSDINPATGYSDLVLNSCPEILPFPQSDIVYQVDIGLIGPPGPLAFEGFLSPIDGADATGGSYESPIRTFKLKSTIPVKFSVSAGGSPSLSGVHTLQVIKWSSQTDSATPIDATPADSATTGDEFRIVGDQWHFNLDVQATGMSVGVWQVIATLSDGSQHFAWIQIK